MQKALEILKNGGVILYPTDTIWGIGCDATNVEAINKIFEIKKREKTKSMIILVENERRLQDLVDVPEMAWQIIDLSEKPVTIVYENPKNLPKEILAEDGSIGIRLVKDDFCKKLISKLNKPLVSTSANFSGDKSPLKFSDISQELIDAVDYDKSYHYPLLKDQSGVSLERINPEGESNDKNNWYSAASTAGFATPTYQNSQFSKTQNTQNERFSLGNTRLSPDGDGFEDFLLVGYKSDLIGMTATIQIYDFDGRLVKTLVNNELLSSEGNFRWDGETDNANAAPLGIYVVLIRYFSPDGVTGQEKKVVSVVGRL